jgi:hypothetical protein
MFSFDILMDTVPPFTDCETKRVDILIQILDDGLACF